MTESRTTIRWCSSRSIRIHYSDTQNTSPTKLCLMTPQQNDDASHAGRRSGQKQEMAPASPSTSTSTSRTTTTSEITRKMWYFSYFFVLNKCSKNIWFNASDSPSRRINAKPTYMYKFSKNVVFKKKKIRSTLSICNVTHQTIRHGKHSHCSKLSSKL